MTEHDRVVAEGLLERPPTRPPMRGWPDWARSHVRSCEACRQVLIVDSLLGRAAMAASARDVGGRARTRNDRLAPGPAPSLASLRARPRRTSTLLTAADLAEDLPPFPVEAWRNASSASLTVTRTPDGVHVSDPEAHDLAVYVVTSEGRARSVFTVADEEHGVVVHLPLRIDAPLRVVVLGTSGGLDPEFWRLWLQERAQGGADPLVDSSAAGRLHAAELRLLPPARPSRLRLAREPVPRAQPPVQAQLSAARALGGAGRAAEAGRTYAAAHVLAQQLGDVGGELRAAVGVAATLVDCGMEEDAERGYRDVVDRFDLDAGLAAFVSRGLAWRAVAVADLATASAWIQELARHCPADDPLLAQLRMAVALEARDAPGVLAARAAAARPDDPELDAAGAVWEAVALTRLGRAAEARSLLAALPVGTGGSSDARLWRLVADRMAGLGGGDDAQFIARLDAARHDVTGRAPTAWERRPLHALVRQGMLEGAPRSARHAAELLCGGGPAGSRARLGIACADGDTLVVEAEGGLRTSPVARSTWKRLVRDLRTAVLHGGDLAGPAQVLADLLFITGCPAGPDGLSVASDGALAGLPWAAVFAAAGLRLPPVAELIERSTTRDPESRRIVSLADADGRLPGAGREVRVEEADVWLRGRHATFAALGAVGEVGLLHLGLHAERIGGVPTLYFADRPVSALELAGLRLRGSPTVLLSGCATGEADAPAGIEGSLAHAFLRAGASSVVATHWPVRDAEGLALFRPLVASWEDQRPETAVAGVSRQLHEAGRPARCWAAVVVYR